MGNIILDATIVSNLCISCSQTARFSKFLTKIDRTNTSVWIYVPEISEILHRIEIDEVVSKKNSPPDYARDQLREFSQNCQWLAALSEDAIGLVDSDPIAVGLTLGCSRLSDSTVVITEDPGRLSRGKPFLSIETYAQYSDVTDKILFVDLGRQQNHIRPKLEKSVHKIFHHGEYIFGPEIEELEFKLAKHVGVDYCVGVSSGTDALLISLLAVGLEPGDEVITTPFSFIAAAEMMTLIGVKPVYVDIDPRTYNLDPANIVEAITSRTRAIVPVSMYGQAADMDKIVSIAAHHSLIVIEDAAQSFGAKYKGRSTSGLSDIGCTSFFPSKPLGAYGDAGACFTSSADLAEKMKQILNHGQQGRYNHVRLGLNSRMDSIQAAVLLAKLDLLDDEITKRTLVSERYDLLLNREVESGQLKLPYIEPYNVSAWAQYTVEVDERDKVQKFMEAEGCPTAIHYPEPLYSIPVLRQDLCQLPNTERACNRVLSLPMHPYMDYEEQETIAKSLQNAIGTGTGAL